MSTGRELLTFRRQLGYMPHSLSLTASFKSSEADSFGGSDVIYCLPRELTYKLRQTRKYKSGTMDELLVSPPCGKSQVHQMNPQRTF